MSVIDHNWIGSKEYYELFSSRATELIKINNSSIYFEPWVKLWPKPLQDTARSVCLRTFMRIRGYEYGSSSKILIDNLLIDEFIRLYNIGYLDEVLRQADALRKYYEINLGDMHDGP